MEGAIDTIASIGPVDGAIVGAATFGPVGAAAGIIAGRFIQRIQLINPDLVDNIKNNKITKSFEKGIDDCGKVVKDGIKTIKTWRNDHKIISYALDILSPIPKIPIPNWF